MNQVEIWFITHSKRLLRWGSFKGVGDLEDSIHHFFTQHNEIWEHSYKLTYNDVSPSPKMTFEKVGEANSEEASCAQ